MVGTSVRISADALVTNFLQCLCVYILVPGSIHTWRRRRRRPGDVTVSWRSRSGSIKTDGGLGWTLPQQQATRIERDSSSRLDAWMYVCVFVCISHYLSSHVPWIGTYDESMSHARRMHPIDPTAARLGVLA